MSNDSSGSEWELYRYTPSKGAAIALTVLFIVTTLIYSLQVVWDARKASKPEVDNPFDTPVDKCESITAISLGENYKKLTVRSTFSAFIPLFFGCIMEIVGYIARAVSSSNTKEIAPYVIQAVLLLIAPALYAATIYMLFGRLLHVMRCESLMIVSSRFGTSFFVFGDVVSFCLQAAGGGLMATVNGRTTGSNLITAGLVIQIVFFGVFIINEFRFSYSYIDHAVKLRCATTTASINVRTSATTTESTNSSTNATTTASTNVRTSATTTASINVRTSATTTESTNSNTNATTTESTNSSTNATTTASINVRTSATTTESTNSSTNATTTASINVRTSATTTESTNSNTNATTTESTNSSTNATTTASINVRTSATTTESTNSNTNATTTESTNSSTNATTTASINVRTSATTTESTNSNTNATTTESTNSSTNATTTESTNSNTSATTTESTNSNTNATTTESTNSSTNATTTEGTNSNTSATTTASTNSSTNATTTESTNASAKEDANKDGNAEDNRFHPVTDINKEPYKRKGSQMVLLERKKLKAHFPNTSENMNVLQFLGFRSDEIKHLFLYGIDIYFCPEGVFTQYGLCKGCQKMFELCVCWAGQKVSYRRMAWEALAVERMLRNDEEYKEYLEDIEPYHGDPVGYLKFLA
ncbi:ASB_collapsed_G0006880.mRNA.1.CDS.1 [Saccharomyces cerevisiae]|nr:ASB_collapsed_G0006880.mRNA.1.CDS.1 [Saccharomyces cerevisiae]